MKATREATTTQSGERREHTQKGQTLIFVGISIFVLLIIIGLGVDLGLFYVERVRITRAVDAAALAAAAELPFEQTDSGQMGAAPQRAIEFLLENGYDAFDPSTRLVWNGAYVSGPETEEQATTIIELDTASFRDQTLPPAQQVNSADRIRVRVLRRVPVIFMRFIGFTTIPAVASATAENINNLDIVIVFDRSGSMEFDTLCYGCWAKNAAIPYPGGNLYPLPWRGDANGPPQHCGATTAYSTGGYQYYFIEAEEYSRLSNPYDRFLYTYYYTYWVMQREPNDGASGRDSRGAYIEHMPYVDNEASDAYGVTCRQSDIASSGSCYSNVPGGPFPAPRADYDFTVLNSGSYYIWVRAQAPSSWPNPAGIDRRLFWSIDGGTVNSEGDYARGTGYNGASANAWRWRRLNDTAFNWQAGVNHVLSLWPSGAGFAVDRIVITNNPGGAEGGTTTNLAPLDANRPCSDVNQCSGRGSSYWANGRTDWACNPCDARFAGHPGQTGYREMEPNCSYGPNPDRRYDDIYDDEQPIRAALEAAKRFVARLDPRYDQIGYVYYSSSASIRSELQCLRRLGSDACTPQVITDTVMAQIDQTYAGGSTDIGGGIKAGIQVLSTQSPHYGRPGAAHVMILMTDGRANVVPDTQCYQQDLWPDNSGSTNEVRARDCVIYYAQQARNNSIVIYTITLGTSADFELMQAVADLTGGVHRNADRPEKLNEIFDELYERIFLRLVD